MGGLAIGAFVVDSSGVHFKQCSRAEALAAKESKVGSNMYVQSDPGDSRHHRLLKAVVGEGMPTLKNPFVHGNLFLLLAIDFPDALTHECQESLRQILPPPLHKPTLDRDDPEVEEHTLVDVDPYTSQVTNAANMNVGGEAYDEDDQAGDFRRASQGAQCHQM